MLGHEALGRLALGQAPDLTRTVLAEVGAFTITGQAASATYGMPAEAGAFTIGGQAVSRTLNVIAGAGAFSITGQDIALLRTLVLEAEPTVALRPPRQPMFSPLGMLALGESVPAFQQTTTFVLTGIDTQGTRRIPLIAETGVFTITGQDVVLILEAYPPKIRVFPRVAFGVRSRAQGGGPMASVTGRSAPRARAFGG